MHNGLMPAFGTMKRRAVIGAAVSGAEDAAADTDVMNNPTAPSEPNDETYVETGSSNSIPTVDAMAAQRPPPSGGAGNKRARGLDDIDEDEGPTQATSSEKKKISEEDEVRAKKVSMAEATPPAAASPIGSGSVAKPASAGGSSSIAAFTSDTLFRRKTNAKTNAADAGKTKTGGPADAKFLGSFFK